MKISKIDQNSKLYSKALEIWNDVWPDYSESIEEWKHFDDNFSKEYFLQRFIVEFNKKYVATGYICEPWWSYVSGKYHIDIAVLREFRNQGVGSFCLEYLELILSDRNGTKLNVHGYEGYSDGIQFLEKNGYKIVLREPGSKLMINDFNFSKFSKSENEVESKGIKMYSLTQLRKLDKNWQRNLYDLYCQIIKDVPNNDELTERSFEQFRKLRFDSPNFEPDAFFVALDGKKYVGLSSLLKQSKKPKEFWTDLTGIIPNYRRKGIAVALKVKTIKYVKDFGGKSIEADNEENNPMYNINLLLGFKPLPAWLTYEKIYK